METHTQVAPPVPAPDYGATIERGFESVNKGLQDPAKMGLLATGLTMMAQPPRAVPYSAAEVLGKGGLAGIKAFETALEAKRRQQALDTAQEEHRLTREENAMYRRGLLEEKEASRKIAEQGMLSLEAQRKAQTEETERLKQPVSDAYWKAIGRDDLVGSGITKGELKDLQSTYNMANKPEKAEKEKKLDPFTKWVESFEAENKRPPNAKEISVWHRDNKAGGAGGGDERARSADISHVNNEVVTFYYQHAKDELAKKGPEGMAEVKAMTAMFSTNDPLSLGANRARVREALSPEMRKEFDWVTRRAQKYAREMVPAEAVAKAKEEWDKLYPPKAAAPAKKKLDKETAKALLKEAGGDQAKAEKLARERNYDF